MRFEPTDLPEVILVEPDVHRDARGFFLETWHAERYLKGGVSATFVQDNVSRSERGTLRGLHAQVRNPQGKLVRVISGEVWDVAVDIRRGSPTFGRWVGARLGDDDFQQLWIPPGFAHGFCVTSEEAIFAYKCTTHYDRQDEIAVLWNDPALSISWPIAEPLLSERDREAPLLADLTDLPVWQG